MARDFNAQMKDLIAADKQREAKQAATAFQIKVVKSLENTLGSPEAVEQTRARLAAYTAARSAYGDLVKIMGALRARCAGEIRRSTSGQNLEVRRRTGAEADPAFERAQEATCGRRPLRDRADRKAAEDALAIDPPCNQGRAQQERRRYRRHALRDCGLDGARPDRRQSHGLACRV